MHSMFFHLFRSSSTNPSFTSTLLSLCRFMPKKGINDFAFFVGKSVEEETSQPSLIIRLSLEYGIVKCSTFLDISLCSFTDPYFTSIYPPTSNNGVNDFAFYGGKLVEEETSQHRQKLEYGIVMYSGLSQHLSIVASPTLFCAVPLPTILHFS